MIKISINPEYERLLPPLSPEQFEELKRSISEEGLLYSIITNSEGRILDGHNRYRAMKELGLRLKSRNIVVKAFDSPLIEKRFVVTANLQRRHLNSFQRVECAIPLLEIERELAKDRKSMAGRAFGRGKDGTASNEANLSKGKATELVARQAGVSPATFERALLVIEGAPEDLKDQARAGEISVNDAYQQTRFISRLKSPNLRDSVGPERAVELHKLDDVQRPKAVEATLAMHLYPEEVTNLVTNVLGGSSVDQAIGKIQKSRDDERTSRWREIHNGITNSICVICRQTIKVKHEDGNHTLLKDQTA